MIPRLLNGAITTTIACTSSLGIYMAEINVFIKIAQALG